MICKNCHQDTGNKVECPYCGFNPAYDENGAAPRAVEGYIAPAPIQIVPKKVSNGKATAALVLSFFTPCVVPGILSFIFAIIGFFRAKNCRSGRVRSIFALLIIAAWIYLFYTLVTASGSAT